MLLLPNHLIGFVLLVIVGVSCGQQFGETFESNPWQSDESVSSYLFERQYNPVHGSSKLMLPPSATSSGIRYSGAETFSRPVIIVSGRGLKDQAEIRQVRGTSAITRNKVKYQAGATAEEEEEDEEAEERPTVVVETKKKKKKVDQPISAYVPTAYVIGNQGAGQQPVSRVKQESDKDYGIMVVSPKQPENYAIINGNYQQGVNEEMLDRNTIQLYQEPQLVEALQVEGPDQIKEVSVDDKDESLDAQKSKLTLLFLGYEKF